MRLKKIRLAGFKSFVDPTNIPFPGDMTAVVGPNGCGKSNVIDAVRWVLGESSAKNLRGDSMTDVIFNGSSARKPVSQCSVELVFDNSSGRIQGEFAAFNEISVKRIVTKDAVSSYWLNSAKCRRRDITDLFLGTGLGPRSYAIIEQGMISKLIESKPQDLRVFIEEAAGISKYKERRKETQTRIAHTKENLERLEDVRQELGDQIAKLKRQAAAATKYKELKQLERTLKAELATIRWMTQSNIMQAVQNEINEKQTALEALVNAQQGDESGLQALKNDQSVLKQEIDDVQQRMFTLGTDITKLEQSQIFAQKRLAQIQSEVSQLKQGEASAAKALQTIEMELAQTQEKLLDAQPQKEMLEEQVYDIENKKLDLDEQLQTFLRNSKSHDDIFHNKKQLLQQKHSRIQQSLATQQRLSSQISQLQEEHLSINQADVDIQIQTQNSRIHESDKRLTLLNQESASAHAALLQAKDELTQKQTDLQNAKNSMLSQQTKLETLQDMLQAAPDNQGFLAAFDNSKLDKAWQYFKVQAGYEQALHSALQDIQDGYVVQARFADESILDSLQSEGQYQGPALLFSGHFTAQKQAHTLAEKLLNQHVPSFTNKIYVADNLQQALSLLSSIDNSCSVVCKDGTILHDCGIIPAVKSDNKVLRQAQIEALTETIAQQQPLLQDLHAQVQQLTEHVLSCEQQYQHLNESLSQAKLQAQQYQLDLDKLVFQQQQYQQRNEKLLQDIDTQQTELAQEEMSLELLNEEVEDLSIEVAELEESRSQSMQHSENLQLQQQQAQVQFNQMQARLHEQAMQQQQLQNSMQILQEQQNSKALLLADNDEKLALLQEEAEDLLLPEHDQQEKLQTLLSQQEALRETQQQKREALLSVENDINDLEKGKHGIVSKMDAIKAQIASLRIQSESANVRAQSHIAQLAELSQSVKDIIADLDENADEKVWQTNLDNTTASLQRLGAVNLAAVEEYEQQFERKKHLDDQNEDLTQALDTLENAMRKIDKETRSRFKITFDKVNGDLKMLFPKVFGGGSAYLDLTGEDLLETGVTIMARPPGKKNSTIHLLSGGEKALTALSLVFAIFRLNPAPFCLLDEVDAPLDDANVGRFCRLVSEMSKTVQFIYITHNKVAMEMASHLTGVTMAEPGVSRMVAVDMEQALAIAE